MKILFWNVDTQRDFMDEAGALYVQGAKTIRPNLKRLTDIAKDNNIQVVNTGDCHNPFSKEISLTPNFVNTFPPHCLPDEDGIDFIPETRPDTPYNIDYLVDSDINVEAILRRRNVVIYKDDFDVFIGNRKTANILRVINPELVVVYGVATNVCVDKAVQGLLDRGRIVYVVLDAIKEVPTISVDTVYNSWKNRGVKLVTVDEVAQMFVAPPEPKKEEELITPATPTPEPPAPEPKIEEVKPVEPKSEEAPKAPETPVEKKEEAPIVTPEAPKEEKPTDPQQETK
jgi:nicotinamidase/pyrazinamidase